jgi:hypothetical protein
MALKFESRIALLVAGLCLALAGSGLAQSSAIFPRIEGESFAGQKIVLPDAASGKIAVLIFGFSKASKEPTSAWGKKLSDDFKGKAGLDVYQLPVLEDVPRLIRGFVVSSIKKGTPENLRDHFVPILQGEADLKKTVMFKEPDDAYLVVLDRAGNVVQQLHGKFSETEYGPLRGHIQSLLNQK